MRGCDYVNEFVLKVRDNSRLTNVIIFKAGTGIGKSVVMVPQLFARLGAPLICT